MPCRRRATPGPRGLSLQGWRFRWRVLLPFLEHKPCLTDMPSMAEHCCHVALQSMAGMPCTECAHCTICNFDVCRLLLSLLQDCQDDTVVVKEGIAVSKSNWTSCKTIEMQCAQQTCRHEILSQTLLNTQHLPAENDSQASPRFPTSCEQ